MAHWQSRRHSLVFYSMVHLTSLLLSILGVQSAPLWDSSTQKFIGMLTVTDYIRLILHYYNHASSDIMEEIEDLQIIGLKNITYKTDKRPIITLDPRESIYVAAHILLKNKLHRLPLVTADHSIVSVVTQFKILKYITQTCPEVYAIRECPIIMGVGSYNHIATATHATPLLTLLNLFVERRLSSIPILDNEDRVIDVCEKYDILNLARENAYYDLDMKICEALARRSPSFEGIHSCRINDTLGGILQTISQETVHRFVVVDGENKLKGVISLSDILRYLVGL